MKVHAWRSLHRTQDADDVAALLRAVSASGQDVAAIWSHHPDLESARSDLRRKGRVWASHMVRDAGWTPAEVAQLKYAARTIT